MRPVVLVALVLSLSACDRTSPAPAASAAPKEASKPVPTEIAEDTPHLPAGFISADITELFVTLRDAGKSEFETTEAYKKRRGDEARTYSFLVEPTARHRESAAHMPCMWMAWPSGWSIRLAVTFSSERASQN